MMVIKFILAFIVGFLIIYVGSVFIPGFILPILFGPYPSDGNVPFMRIFSDFWISFLFAVIGGYVAAKIYSQKPILISLLSGLAYFSLSAYWYTGYDLSGAEWITPFFMLIKVPIGAMLGGYIAKKI